MEEAVIARNVGGGDLLLVVASEEGDGCGVDDVGVGTGGYAAGELVEFGDGELHVLAGEFLAGGEFDAARLRQARCAAAEEGESEPEVGFDDVLAAEQRGDAEVAAVVGAVEPRAFERDPLAAGVFVEEFDLGIGGGAAVVVEHGAADGGTSVEADLGLLRVAGFDGDAREGSSICFLVKMSRGLMYPVSTTT